MTEGGADEGAWHQPGGNILVQRQRWHIAEINDNKDSSGGGWGGVSFL